jgi:hypothetical protein
MTLKFGPIVDQDAFLGGPNLHAMGGRFGATVLEPDPARTRIVLGSGERGGPDSLQRRHSGHAVMCMSELAERLTHRGVTNTFVPATEYHAPRIDVPDTRTPDNERVICVDYCEHDVPWRPYNVLIEGTQRRTHDLDDAVLQIELALGIQRTAEDLRDANVAMIALGHALGCSGSRALAVVERNAANDQALGVSVYPNVYAYQGHDEIGVRVTYDALYAPEAPYRFASSSFRSRGWTLDAVVGNIRARFAGMR